MTTIDRNSLQEAISKHLNAAILLSQQLKDHPEVAYEEKMASKEISHMLEKAGYQVTYPYLSQELGYDTAFMAVLENGEGPNIAILAEYDALPGIGHGCGHNLHGALSVLSALALADLRQQFQGTITVFGTPAEEANGAKILMAKKGIFDHMDLAVMMHCWSGGVSQPDMDVLSLRCYEIEFFGTQAHAVASPWHGKSALAAARKFLDLVDARRECFTPDIKVNSIIQDGGIAPNIIPEHARIRMEFRTDSKKKLEDVDDLIRKCAQGAALALDCKVTFTPGLEDFADMVRVEPLEREISDLLRLEGATVGPVSPPVGSSDVGNVSYACPTIQPLLSITAEPFALHTEEFRDATCHPHAYRALEQGAMALSMLALRVLVDKGYQDEVLAAFRQQLEEKTKQ